MRTSGADRAAGALLLALLAGCGTRTGPTNSAASPPIETASPAPASTSATSGPPAALPSPTGADGHDFPPVGELRPGRYPMRLDGIGMTMAVPAGWSSNGSYLLKKAIDDGGAQLIFWDFVPDGVYADPCSREQAPAVPDPTAASLAAAIQTIPGIDVSDPVEATIGGRPAVQVAIDIPENLACMAGSFYLWYDEATGGRWAPEAGSTMTVWIIEAAAGTVWIDSETWPDTSPSLGAEIAAMIDSVIFD